MIRLWGFVALGLLMVGRLAASGMTEDPAEVLTRTWHLPEFQSLEVRGQIQFALIPGSPDQGTTVTVETTRALFDQLTVSEWFGAGTIAIEAGLRGPREQGPVKVTVSLPALKALTVLGRSSGKVTWPSDRGRIFVGEESALDLVAEATELEVETSWLTNLVLGGHVGALRASLRHQARVDARNLSVGTATVALDEASLYLAGPTGKGFGSTRHGSRIGLSDGWDSLSAAKATGLVRSSTWMVQVELLPP
jgi:hypothetical protein